MLPNYALQEFYAYVEFLSPSEADTSYACCSGVTIWGEGADRPGCHPPGEKFCGQMYKE